jgi:hypothetical protein
MQPPGLTIYDHTFYKCFTGFALQIQGKRHHLKSYENTLGNVWLTHPGPGTYLLKSKRLFTSGLTSCWLSNALSVGLVTNEECVEGKMELNIIDVNTIEIKLFQDPEKTIPLDDRLSATIRIWVYESEEAAEYSSHNFHGYVISTNDPNT